MESRETKIISGLLITSGVFLSFRNCGVARWMIYNLLSTIVVYQIKADWSRPQWSRHYVGVPMFWYIWQYQKMRQHQNHFEALGSSPPGPGEGSLQ